MSRKHDNKGRRTGDGHYFQMFEWLMRTTAWQHASVYERSLYIELKRRYNGKNNGDIAMGHREAERLLGCSNKPVRCAFNGLQQKGFIAATVKGSFDWKASRDGKNHGRSTRWRLTELPQDLPERVLSGGTKDFLRWQPGMDLSEKSAVCPKRTNGMPTVHHSEKMVRSEHTIKQGVYAYGTR